MVLVRIDNSYSQITGLNPAQEKALSRILSYSEDAQASFYKGGFGPRRVPLMSKRGEFPTGLLPLVYDYVLQIGVDLDIDDTRQRPLSAKPLTLSGAPVLYEAQKTAVKALIDAGRGTISMPTGTGKSLVIAQIIATLGHKALVVVPTLEIKEQLKASIFSLLGKNAPVVVENIGSARLKTLTDFDVLIIDEAHHVAAKTYRALNKGAWKNIYYRVFMTATPFRSNKNENILFQTIAGEVIYELTYIEAIEKGYIVPVEAYYLQMPKSTSDAHTWQEFYKQCVVHNDVRNDMIGSLLNSLHLTGVSTLCLVKEVEHGQILSDMSGAAFTHGQDEESRQYIQWFNARKVKTLIGTTGILGEGIDTRPCEYVVIVGLGKAKSQFMQQVGRAVRKYPGKESAKIIIIKDTSHKFGLRHFKAQCTILKEAYNVVPIRLEFE